MAVKQVTINQLGTVSLYKRRGNRSLRLTIGASGEVRVSMPPWLPYSAGEQFAISKQAWILDNLPRISDQLQHGQRVGKAHRLYFQPQESLVRVSTRLHQNEVRITHPKLIDSQNGEVQTAARRACIRALKREAQQLLPSRVMTLSEQTGLAYNSLNVKQLKSRWGSCNSGQDITLNLFLMQLPWHLIDYVIVHELVHTKIMRHGAPFWQELERHLPTAKQLKKEIANHHPILLTHASDNGPRS